MGEKSDLWKDAVEEKFVTNLAKNISQVYSSFDQKSFVRQVMADRFLSRELKDRLNTIALHLKDFLPKNYKQATNILIKAAPLVGEFANWSLTSYVEQFGGNEFDQSIKVLRELTKHGTSEFGIRPFVVSEPEKMIAVFKNWATDENEHIRRLAAEGSRPRGVWVAHIPEYKRKPKGVLEILELLKADPSLYVRKAVANNLNDISKENPKLVIRTAKKWFKVNNPHTLWIVRHGCRTLLKQGNPDALELFGYNHKVKLEPSTLSLDSKRIKIGERIKFKIGIISRDKHQQHLMIDYRVTFTKVNGRTSSKTFKLSKKTINPAQTLKISGTHSFQNLSTRKHYPGQHKIELLINSQSLGSASFDLI